MRAPRDSSFSCVPAVPALIFLPFLVLPPSSVATPCLNANVSWPACVGANAINKDVGVHTKVSLNVRHRVVSPARIAERTASPENRLKL